MRTIVVTDRETKQVIACVPEHGEAICRKDVEVSVFNDTEPLFTETPFGPVLEENTFLIKFRREIP